MASTSSTNVTRLLVANRGEIARRVFRTCRDLGIETVAVHSDADAGMPFVRDADTAVHLPGNTPADTYLRADLIVEAAHRSGADAIHPGYGFLSENADFARAVIAAGITWVGPAPESIEQMGSKIESKKLMESAGVPVLPSWTELELGGRVASASSVGGRVASASSVGGRVASASSVGGRVASASERIETPVLVKASAGGGGRGMRIVRDIEALPAEIERASAEAASAFGDGTVFVEPYVENGRHVEVQVLGTVDGVLILGERDCSVQRRHQKVIEEAPAPGLSDATRSALHEAARKAAQAIDYRGAGTVEFLYDADKDRFYFLEMNTRLQVEHPVTEAVFGLDLVALQIAVAEGRGLDTLAGARYSTNEEVVAGRVAAEGQGPVVEEAREGRASRLETRVPSGHAVEVRLYAEDPAAGYQPQSGRITAFDIPGVRAEFENLAGPGIRLDSGVGAGDEIGTFYDAMIAKVVAWAPTREEALRRLAGALAKARIHGLKTNRDLLVNLLRDPVVVEAQMFTTWLDGADLAVLGSGPGGPDALALSGFAAAIALAEQARLGARVQGRIPAGWRNVVSQPQVTTFVVPTGSTNDDSELEVRWYGGRSFSSADLPEVRVVAVAPELVTLENEGVRRDFSISVNGDRVDVDSSLGHVALVRKARFVDPTTQVAAGSLLAPMPGSVIGVRVSVGDSVAEGDPILVMEAMKMQHTISAPYAGVVAELNATEGQQVEAGAVLAVVSANEAAEEEESA